MKSFLTLMFLIFVPFLAFAGGIGTTSALFLREDPNARGFSLAGLYGSLVNDVGAAYVNPAVLGHITGHQIEISAWKGVDAVSQYNFIGADLIAGRVGAFSINYLSYDSGSEKIYDINGNLSKITLQKDYAISAGWGRNIGENLFVGGQIKSVNSELAETYSANALTFDAGVIYKSLDDKFTIGVGVQNISGQLKYLEETDPLPRIVRGEISYRFAIGRDSMLIGAVIKKPTAENTLDGGGGIEYAPAWMPIALRVGMRREAEEMTFTTGLGLNWKAFSFDYGFQPAGKLGEATQRLSLSMNFGPVAETGRAEAFKNKGMKRKAIAMGYTYTGPKIPVLVLQRKAGAGVTAKQASAIADVVRTRLGNSPKLQLVAREQTEQILKKQRFQLSGIVDEQTSVKIGKMLGVKKIFQISVSRLKIKYALTIKIIDVETGTQDKAFNTTADDIGKLYKAAIKLTDEIVLNE